ncbi:MAG: glycosyltransferase [Elusimicrobiota bacterium]
MVLRGPSVIDIAVVSHNARDSIRPCFDSLVRHTRGAAHRILFFDNASSDGTPALLRSLARRRGVEIVLSRRNLGAAGAVNALRRRLKSEWLVLLDDDARATPGWLPGLLRAAASRPGVGIVGCKVTAPGGRIFTAELTPAGTACGHGESDEGQRDYRRACECVAKTCWLMRRSLFSRVGLFDERFFPCQFEDADYCLRARLKGFRVLYEGGAAVSHAGLFRIAGPQFARNRKLFERKWLLRPRFPLADSHPWDRAESEAQGALRRGDVRGAIARYRLLARIHPANAEVRSKLGALYFSTGDFRAARRSLSSALRRSYFPRDLARTLGRLPIPS